MSGTVFMTGGGGFIGRHILARILEEGESDVILLEHGLFRQRLTAFLDTHLGDPMKRARVKVLEGDITQPGLGLAPEALDEVRERVTHAIHLAALYNLSIPRDVAVQVNVEGTRNVLDVLAAVKHLKAFAHTSTLAVAGDCTGVFSEDDFDRGQTFKNFYEETKFLSEKLVRERWDSIPAMVLRPPVVVGDSKTGEIEKIDGPYYLLTMVSRRLHYIMPNAMSTKCHIGPVDYVADAFCALLFDASALGQVFLLTDPDPVTYREFIDLACERMGRMKPLLWLPPAWLRPMAKNAAFQKLSGLPFEAFQYADYPVEYATPRTVAALARHGIACPRVPAYIDVMIRYFLEHHGDPNVRRGNWKQGTT
jgi:thioester reductase-like protein